MLRKLCLPFSPYRQRPDITLHGREAVRTVIRTKIRPTSLTTISMLLTVHVPSFRDYFAHFLTNDRW